MDAAKTGCVKPIAWLRRQCEQDLWPEVTPVSQAGQQ